MSDNIPSELQLEIIKKVFDVKSLIRFRSVSKPWKSFIDSSDFIKGYGARHTHPHSFILRYKLDRFSDDEYSCLVDDDNESFKVQQQEFAPSVAFPLHKQYWTTNVVGACHGLFCLVGVHRRSRKWMVVIWNPSIRKSFGIAAVRNYDPYTHIETHFGFGVCPVTRDPTVVKVLWVVNMPWHVEVFTLSSGVWNVIPTSNLLRQSIRIMSPQVLIDRFIYWGASDMTYADAKYIVVSFDLITKEFKVVDLPDSLTNELNGALVFVSKLRESLVVYGSSYFDVADCCGVWVMEHDSSFRKLFSIGASVYKILGFRKNGEPIFETSKEGGVSTVNVYNPRSQQIKNLGISGVGDSFFMCSYKESLLLVDHLDLHVYNDNNGSK